MVALAASQRPDAPDRHQRPWRQCRADRRGERASSTAETKLVMPSLYLWRIAYGLLPEIVGAEKRQGRPATAPIR